MAAIIVASVPGAANMNVNQKIIIYSGNRIDYLCISNDVLMTMNRFAFAFALALVAAPAAAVVPLVNSPITVTSVDVGKSFTYTYKASSMNRTRLVWRRRSRSP
jgi:hypothetical protein